MRKKIPSPASGGLILSYKCNAECLHCMYACSPHWDAHWISKDYLQVTLERLAGHILASPYGSDTISLNYGLHFTGGEPFLNFDLLCTACELCSELDIPSLFAETNCFWCVNDEKTREKLLLLKDKGLKGLLISVNPFYLEYVPFERTERAIRIGHEIFGNNLMVYQLEYYWRFKKAGITDRVPFDDYLMIEKKEDFLRNVEFFVLGRAAYKLGERLKGFLPKYPAELFFNEPCRPHFLRDWHNHFDNYGNYVPGYCGGISLGNIRELDSLLKDGIDVRKYPVLGYLMEENIEGLLRMAEDYGYQRSKEGYFTKCHLCIDIRRHLVSVSDFKELRPKEFYLHLD